MNFRKPSRAELNADVAGPVCPFERKAGRRPMRRFFVAFFGPSALRSAKFRCITRGLGGASPSGKASVFGIDIPRFESWRPSQFIGCAR